MGHCWWSFHYLSLHGYLLILTWTCILLYVSLFNSLMQHSLYKAWTVCRRVNYFFEERTGFGIFRDFFWDSKGFFVFYLGLFGTFFGILNDFLGFFLKCVPLAVCAVIFSIAFWWKGKALMQYSRRFLISCLLILIGFYRSILQLVCRLCVLLLRTTWATQSKVPQVQIKNNS